jgi:protein TonB
LLQLSPVPATPYVEQLSIGAGRRALAISLAVLIPALLLLLLLAYGSETPPDYREERVSVVSLEATEISEDAPEPSSAERERAEEQPVPPQPTTDETPPSEPAEPLPPPVTVPKAAPAIAPPSERPPSPAPPRIGVRPPGGQVYGPPNIGGSSSSRDTERVGTAPNGEPLYAAAWYREPSDGELRGYLSTASGPGWGLIACRTAPDYRVEDCVGLDEYPNGSQINRAVLAAAWAFRVRPPRLGGQPLVGAWVRIRIDYGIKRR